MTHPLDSMYPRQGWLLRSFIAGVILANIYIFFHFVFGGEFEYFHKGEVST
jgi:hypothetical protein